MKDLLVIKIGSAVLTTQKGDLSFRRIHQLVSDLAKLQPKHRLVLVSSGAIAAGHQSLGLNQKSLSVVEQRAAAAVGNRLLGDAYARAGKKHGLTIAQVLCERSHFADREKFLSLRGTLEVLWKKGAIPIFNENDVISDIEIRFSDNDELAALLAGTLGAKKLLLGTKAEGLLDRSKKLVKQIDHFSAEIFDLVQDPWNSSQGRGGMASKLRAARIATQLGVTTMIFSAMQPKALILANKTVIGTLCVASSTHSSSAQRWLAGSALPGGKLVLDSGAIAAISKRRSLLLVGIKEIQGDFLAGETVEIMAPNQAEPIAVGRVKFSAENLRHTKNPNGIEVCHADQIHLWKDRLGG